MKSFNLKEYLANPSRKVLTMDGRPVRIICTDYTDEFPIVASVPDPYDSSAVHLEQYDAAGHRKSRYRTAGEVSLSDLRFDEEKRVGFVSLVRDDSRIYAVNKIFATEEEARKSQIHKRDYAGVARIEWTE